MSGPDVRPVLVTGGAGFIGANLADRLAGAGREVVVFDALARPGVETNLDWLTKRHPTLVRAVVADLRDQRSLRTEVVGAGAVFHLAAQVAVTTSLVDPREDYEVNLGGTFALLEAMRDAESRAPLVFASTNKVYGNLGDVALERGNGAYRPTDPSLREHGVGEDRPLDFHTPYGCSKGAADAYVLDYARSFGLRACVLRMSCIYGPRQMGTEDQGWVAHFLIKALRGEGISIYGDGLQVRDVLHVDDAVDAYLAAEARIDAVAGRAFNLGGGPANAVSLLQVLDEIGRLAGRPPEVTHRDWRAGDQRWYVADPRAAIAALGLAAPKPWREGLAGLAAWLRAEGLAAVPPGARLEPSAPAAEPAAPRPAEATVARTLGKAPPAASQIAEATGAQALEKSS